MKRRLFCSLSPITYTISYYKEILLRKMKNLLMFWKFAKQKSEKKLPILIKKSNSLIRRRLGNVDMHLQENKAMNLSLAAPKINNILIKPWEIFSFWKLVGNPTKKKGYKEGLTLYFDEIRSGIGGGMCQMTNLLHRLVLHSDLKIIEHHHHNRFDLFPDFKRVIPFWTGTSIMYNYFDYRVQNISKDNIYQIILYTTDQYLCGGLRCLKELKESYHIHKEHEFFSEENGQVYRNGEIYQKVIDKKTGKILKDELIIKNHAKVCYPTDNLIITKLS